MLTLLYEIDQMYGQVAIFQKSLNISPIYMSYVLYSQPSDESKLQWDLRIDSQGNSWAVAQSQDTCIGLVMNILMACTALFYGKPLQVSIRWTPLQYGSKLANSLDWTQFGLWYTLADNVV